MSPYDIICRRCNELKSPCLFSPCEVKRGSHHGVCRKCLSPINAQRRPTQAQLDNGWAFGNRFLPEVGK